ncbi:MAG: hypothetical protein IJB28_07025, partial [Bacteroidaceae bacterium]|nr:hypothetical protein [Bacteroidaceae bacterium]
IPGANSKAAKAYYQAFLQAQEKAEAAAERAEEAADRAEAGAGASIIVSIDEGDVATHTAVEIYDAMQNKQTVVYRHDDRSGSEFISLKTASPSKAVFSKTGYPTEFDVFNIEINAQGNVSYKTSFSSELVAQAVEKVETDIAPVSYLPQTRTEEQKAQARENIGASTYYNTPREEIGVAHEDINTEYILGLYRALIENYPKNVQEVEVQSDDGTFTNYAYVISTGEYPTGVYGNAFIKDDHIKKPKYLILSAIDGNERKTALSTYRFIRDVLSSHNVPKYFKGDVIISVMPVGVPYAFDMFGRQNENGVYIERNFDSDWTPTTDSGVNPGAYAASEKETQAISKWLRDNSDADLYIDVHNNGAVHELVTIIGEPNNATTDAVKKIAMRGISKIIPYWRDVIGYSSFISTDGEYKDVDGDGDKEYVIKEMDVIFANSASLEINGTSVALAQKVCGIPSIILETSAYYGDYPEWEQNKTAYPAESIAMGAEAIGNILIEFYEQSSEVIAMNEANAKLDALLLNASFRVVKGTFIPTEDMYVLVPDASDSKKDKYHFTIPGVPTDACILEFMPVDEISKVSVSDYSSGASFPANYGVIPLMPSRVNNVCFGNLDYTIYQNDKETIGASPTTQFKVEFVDGGVKWIIGVSESIKFEVGKKYEWTAYYWND